jgi:asparagine synthase (glutamine-hydrolysing)
MDYIREILLDERTLSRGWFKPEYVRGVLNDHLEGRINHRLLIWSLLSFEWWNRLFLDEPAGDALARPAARSAFTA